MTQLEAAKANNLTPQMKFVAQAEGVQPEVVLDRVKNGRVVIPSNINHKNLQPVGIGEGLLVKVNANIGNSPTRPSIDKELEKLNAALKAGTDTIMDLSVADNAADVLREVIRHCNKPVGTVPIYMAMVKAGEIGKLSLELYLDVLLQQAELGVDFITVHAGVTKRSVELSRRRVLRCVSRGGSFMLRWIETTGKENFLYTHFDRILEIARKYDITLSLGDGMRPGCISDATDKAQIDELKTLGELAKAARDAGVQVMIEGPGHVPLHQIEHNVKLEKEYCDNAPFYVLGPLPTDIAAGYDHVAAAIGGALAAWKGADFLCYVTPKEHIGLPDVEDVYEGVIVAKIAAHVADIARGNRQAWTRDHNMAVARGKVDWDSMFRFALAPDRLKELRRKECKLNPELADADFCSMCGEFCVFKIANP